MTMSIQSIERSHVYAEEDDDWLNDPEEQLQAEDDHWDAFYEQRTSQFLQLREQAQREISAGKTHSLFKKDDSVALCVS